MPKDLALIETRLVSPCCGVRTVDRTLHATNPRHVCTHCKHDCKPAMKVVGAILVPAFNRRPVTADNTLDWFYRGWDFQIKGTERHISVRDCAPNALVRFYHGKKLQKQFIHRVQLTKIPSFFPSDKYRAMRNQTMITKLYKVFFTDGTFTYMCATHSDVALQAILLIFNKPLFHISHAELASHCPIAEFRPPDGDFILADRNKA